MYFFNKYKFTVVLAMLCCWLQPPAATAQFCAVGEQAPGATPQPPSDPAGDGGGSSLWELPDKLFDRVERQTERMSQRLQRSTEKYLRKLARSEQKLARRLAKKDSAAAATLLDGSEAFYRQLQDRLSDSSTRFASVYSSRVDSMQTALRFLEQSGAPGSGPAATLTAKAPGLQDQLSGVYGQYGGVQDQLNRTAWVQQQLKARQQQLGKQLGHLQLTKPLDKYRQQLYYYRSQVQQYRQVFEQPDKWAGALLGVARQVPTFNEFFARHSQLGSLFRLPGASSEPLEAAALAGLQRREQLTGLLQERLGSVSANPQQQLSAGLQQARGALDQAKDRISRLGNAGAEMGEMPGFRPNEEKTKSLLKRLEVGVELQSARGNGFLPLTTDMGLRLGYKLHPKATMGIGASYKLGWGQELKNLHFTHQGMALHSFLDVRLKGSVWLSAAAEAHHRPALAQLAGWRDRSAWQPSALAGVSKKIKLKKNKGEIRLLYDFLWQRQGPGGQPLVVRTGYTLGKK